MLKYTGLIGGTLATLVVVPSATFDDGHSALATGSLEAALDQTVEALELLVGLDGEPVDIDTIREISEAPLPGARERDEKLQLLRTQVNLLQQELDIVESRMLDAADTADAEATATGTARPSNPTGITTGLNASVLEALRRFEKPQEKESAARKVVDVPDYTADALLQAQACYRAGQYERGAALLEGRTDPAGRYWLGRLLERSGALEEAAEAYRAVAEDEQAGSFAERARTNLEFVEWKAEFVEKLPEGVRE